MRVTIITLLFLLVVGAIAYMVIDVRKKSDFVPVDDFAADDARLYAKMRADLQAYLVSTGQKYGGWMDDLVRDKYQSSTVAGQPSKSAAFVSAVDIHYHEKFAYYDGLLSNLKKRYA